MRPQGWQYGKGVIDWPCMLLSKGGTVVSLSLNGRVSVARQGTNRLQHIQTFHLLKRIPDPMHAQYITQNRQALL